MAASSIRAEFGGKAGTVAASRPVAARQPMKRSRLIFLSAAGFITLAAAGYSLTGGRPAEPAEDIVDIANLDALPEAQGQTQARSGGMPIIVPVVLPRPALSPPPVAAPAAAPAPAPQQTVQRGGFGDTAKAVSSAGGSTVAS
jgi:hypothetical protein